MSTLVVPAACRKPVKEVNAFASISILKAVPVGALQEFVGAAKLKPEEITAMKTVMSNRVEEAAIKEGVATGFRLGDCKKLHGTRAGVQAHTAGVLWEYVSFDTIRSDWL